jgi:hypothetical protein
MNNDCHCGNNKNISKIVYWSRNFASRQLSFTISKIRGRKMAEPPRLISHEGFTTA